MTGKKIILIIAIILSLITGVASASSESLNIKISEDFITIGDIVTLNGTVADSKIKCVYLYLSGGDLPPEGTALIGDIRNGRLPREEKYLSGPMWDYSWDTGLIVGGLPPGPYTIYVSSQKTDVTRLDEGSYASIDVEVYDPSVPTESSPAGIISVIMALTGSLIIAGMFRKQ